MKIFVQEGDILELAAPYDVASGAGAQVGSIFGVAVDSYLNGNNGQFAIEGVFDLAKDTSAPAQGAKLYWDNTAKKVTTTATSNLFIGHAALAALTGDATVRVRLHGAPV